MAQLNLEEKRLEALVLFDQVPWYLRSGLTKDEIEAGGAEDVEVALIILRTAQIVLNHRKSQDSRKSQGEK